MAGTIIPRHSPTIAQRKLKSCKLSAVSSAANDSVFSPYFLGEKNFSTKCNKHFFFFILRFFSS